MGVGGGNPSPLCKLPMLQIKNKTRTFKDTEITNMTNLIS